jgi:hypothetical protein
MVRNKTSLFFSFSGMEKKFRHLVEENKKKPRLVGTRCLAGDGKKNINHIVKYQ